MSMDPHALPPTAVVPSRSARRWSTLRTAWLPVALLAAGAAYGAARLDVAADRSNVFLGDSFQLTLRFDETGQDPGPAQFEPSLECTFDRTGSHVESRLTGHGARPQRQQSVVRVVTYRATPRESGLLEIGAVRIRAGRQTFEARGPTVRVVGSESSDRALLELSTSRSTVLVDEPFDVVVSLTVQRLDPPNDSYDPFAPQPLPRLSIPHLAALPGGLKGPRVEDVLQPLLAGTRERFGFSINDINTHQDLFGRAHTARFRLQREAATLGGHPAWRYRLALRLTADLEGSYEFSPASLKAQLVDGVGPGGTPSLRPLYITSQPAVVRVAQPPSAGRPESFIGALGTSLRADARLDAQRCRQGDPLLLTLDLRGDISLGNLRPPALAALPGVAEVFRVYDEAVQSEPLPDGRRYRYTVRPLQAGTIEWPALPISFFDTRQREYRTVFTDPVPLRVDAVAQFSLADIMDAPARQPGSTLSIRMSGSQSVPAAITVVPLPAAKSLPPSPRRLAPWLLPGPLLALGAAWWLRTRASRAVRRRNRRRRHALGRARSAIRTAPSERALLKAMADFFEARYDIPAAAFTPADAADALRREGAPAERIGHLLAALQPLYDRAFSRAAHHSDAPPASSLRQSLLRWIEPADPASGELP